MHYYFLFIFINAGVELDSSSFVLVVLSIISCVYHDRSEHGFFFCRILMAVGLFKLILFSLFQLG
uniref:Uncharacterized protein n=1 Tax=Nelumbo nucifera TaxID=4432 RepID=A0A822ZHE1_NELNU|nr:TPA_asm: hypothetical protein HUJ06_003744 [Nelumbo nucifera]